MTRTRILPLALLLLGSISPACGKDKNGTKPPADGGDTAADGGDTPGDDGAFVPDVPQDPDPEAIVTGRTQFLLGKYQEAVETLAPVYEDLKARKQYRASGLAGGWLALAHAQIVHENADEPSQHAIAMAEKTRDKEVEAVAKIGRGAFLLREEDFAAAQQSFAAAASADPESTAGVVAEILRAEALIGSAFGGGDSNTLQRPEDLEAAKSAYDKAAGAAKGKPEADVLIGRVEEGLAAVAKYKHDKKAICEHAFAAIDRYKAAGAAEFLIEGPNGLATTEKCEP
jgi:tetratricopeptide (TPR) repeat protein